MNNFKALVAAVKANGNKVIDGHSQTGASIKLAGLALLVKGDRKTPVSLHYAAYFSLNEVIFEDNEAELSPCSVGGVVQNARTLDQLKAAIETYNNDQIGQHFSCGKLEEVVLFDEVTEDGSELQAVVQVAVNNNLVIGDDHRVDKTRLLAGVAYLSKGESKKMVGLFKDNYYCLNKLYIADGMVRVSQESVGGNINLPDAGYDLRTAVDNYNEMQKELIWSMGTLTDVVLF